MSKLAVTQGRWKQHQSIDHNQHIRVEFLLAFHSNCVPILHRFWDIVVENRRLSTHKFRWESFYCNGNFIYRYVSVTLCWSLAYFLY